MDLFEQIAAVEFRGPSLVSPRPLLAIEARLAEAAAGLRPEALALLARGAGQVLAQPGTGADEVWRKLEAMAARGVSPFLGELLGAVTAALVERLGAPPVGWQVPSADARLLRVVLDRPAGDCGLPAAREAVALLTRLAKGPAGVAGSYLARLRRDLATLLSGQRLPNFAAALLTEARRRQIPAGRLFEGAPVLRFGEGSRQQRFVGAVPPGQRSLPTTLARRRDVWASQLQAAGLPVASWRVVTSAEAAAREAAALGGAVALRRLERGPSSLFPTATPAASLERRFGAISKPMGGAFLCKLPDGDALRLLAVGGACRGVFRLTPGPRGRPVASEVAATPTLRRLAEQAAEVTGLALLCIDAIAADLDEPDSAIAIVDLDPQPDLELLLLPVERAAGVARDLLALAFPPGDHGRIASVGLLGAEAAAAGPDLAAALAALGRRIGQGQALQAEIDRRRLPMTAGQDPRAALLADPDCDLAVFTLEPQTLRLPGLPAERLEVALLSQSAAPERLWHDCQRLVAEATERALVLDLPSLASLGRRKQPPTILVVPEIGAVPADFDEAAVCLAPSPSGWRLLLRPAGRLPLRLLALVPEEATARRLAWVAGALVALGLHPEDALRPLTDGAAERRL